MTARLRTAIWLLVAAAVAGSSFAWRATSRPVRFSNVVIITLDTTRADRLPAYGFMDTVMPTLDELARDGVVFDQAISVAPLTLPAHTSLFTGLFPPAHGVHDNADEALAARHATLAEVLQARGFRTGAFVGSIVLGPDRGLAQGFDRYSGVDAARADQGSFGAPARQRRADEVVSDAIDWLNGVADSRFLLWAHFYDPHRPYDPPEPYRSAYYDAYIGEIAFADSRIGRLLAALNARHLLEQTMVVVAADHGESLGDHGEPDHGMFLYDSVLRVPLIIRAPGIPSARVGAVVRLTDVMPTVLDLLGVPAPAMDGVSLVDLLNGRRDTLDLEAYSESEYPRRLGCGPLRALRDGRFKLIDGPRPELYDLERDPFEQRNIYDDRRDTADAMMRRLRSFAPADSAARVELSKPALVPRQLTEALAALGYVGSAVTRTPAPSGPLPDARDCIERHMAMSAFQARGVSPR